MRNVPSIPIFLSLDGLKVRAGRPQLILRAAQHVRAYHHVLLLHGVGDGT